MIKVFVNIVVESYWVSFVLSGAKRQITIRKLAVMLLILDLKVLILTVPAQS